MIVTTDIASIIYRDCVFHFGLPTAQEGNIPDGPLTAERVVVHAKAPQKGDIWRKAFVEVNILVPDTKEGKADLLRLNALERQAHRQLRSAGRWDYTPYCYAPESSSVLQAKDLRAHYVNVKLLFKAMNISENP